VSIRFKVILPYLVLTLLVAVTGVYVVTRLVTNTLSERLTNQLLEAGRVVSDGMARQELKHVEVARIVAFTRGVPEATDAGDKTVIASLVRPLAGGLDAENLIVLNRQQELIHIFRQSDGTVQVADASPETSRLTVVLSVLGSSDPQMPPARALLRDPADGRYYYFTAIPITLNGQISGVVVIGTSLHTLLPYLKSISLADVVFYGADGQVIAATMGAMDDDLTSVQTLAVTQDEYLKLAVTEDLVEGANTDVDGRGYSLARGPLRISGNTVGVYAVALPQDYVMNPGSNSRTNTTLLFIAAAIGVILIGYWISRRIINPLVSLVRTSQAIAEGDLNRRSGIRTSDEIGTLATTFDQMTGRLQERTAELERTYHILEQMDRTKASFIDVSAHELRTPLTLIKGYAQMVELKSKESPDLQPVVKGLMEGTERMSDVVNSMLDITKIDSNVLRIMREKVQIHSVIMRVEKTFRKALQERNLTLSIVGLSDLPTILADPDLLYKVFYHLIMNAIKYTPDGGRIKVHGHRIEDKTGVKELEIVIEDTGIGVAIEHQGAIFEKFFQTGEVSVHSSGKTKFKGGGPGLGLAISKGIVEAHYGKIWVESPGHDEEKLPGTKFIVRLPLTGSRPG
jgi:signal transduction histidine kinase